MSTFGFLQFFRRMIYLMKHRKSGFKVGDRVEVNNYPFNGPWFAWQKEYLSSYVGKRGVIKRDFGDMGFYIDFGDNTFWLVPYYMLDYDSRFKKLERILNEDR